MDKRWSTDNGHLKWDSKKYGIATIRLLVKFIGIYWDIGNWQETVCHAWACPGMGNTILMGKWSRIDWNWSTS